MSILEGSVGHSGSTLIDIFDHSVSQWPSATAIQSESTSLTFRALKRRAKKIAKRLNGLGIANGDKVSIQLKTGASELYVAILGTLYSGAAYVPIDADDSGARLKDIQEAANVVAHIGEGGVEVYSTRKPKKFSIAPEDDAWVIFTSGSTGVPKGVAVTHESAANLVKSEQQIFSRSNPIGPKTRVAATLSPAFDASIEEMWLAWSNGATLVPIDRETLTSGPDLARALRFKGIDVLSTVPSLAHFLKGEDLGRMRLLILGGEAVTQGLAEGLIAPGREIWNTYGPTEATIIATAARLEAGKPITIGKPIAGVSVAVVNQEGNPVPLGSEGELVIFGKGLARYLNEDIDALKFKKLEQFGWDRAYFTGDLVRPTAYGLEFIGRTDEQVKVGGKRIDLAEVETAFASMPGIRENAAVAKKTEIGDHEIHCFVTVADSKVSLDFMSEIKSRLPAGILPTVHVIDSLPIKTSGKTDKSKLLTLIPNQLEPTAEASAIESVFAKLLGLSAVQGDTNFFEHGGTSIKVARLVVELRENYPSIRVADVYRHPTPDDLESALSNRPLGILTESRHVVHRPGGASVRSLLAVSLQICVGATIGCLAALLFGIFQGDVDYIALGIEMIIAVAFISGPVRALVSALLIRLITIGIATGVYRRNGLVHARIWFAERIADVFTVFELLGTPWLNLFARITGSTIGKRCSLDSMPPILGNLKIGDGVTVGRDVHLAGWKLQGSDLVVNGFEIGARTRIGNRAFIGEGARVGSDVEIETGTLVEGQILDRQTLHGSPMQANVPIEWPEPAGKGGKIWSMAYGIASPILAIIHLLQYLPLLLLMVLNAGYSPLQPSLNGLLSLVVTAPLSLLLNALFTGSIIRLAGKGVRPGIFPINSREGFCSWLVEKLIHKTRRHSYWIYASLLTPSWLRFLGAKVGSNCEISTFNGQPRLIEIGDECFLADDVSIASRISKNGWVQLGRVTLSNRVFVGNSAQVKGGVTVSSGVLAGVASEIPRGNETNESFFGLPAMSFARSQATGNIEFRYRPSRKLRAKRLFVESWRLSTALVTFALLSGAISLVGPLPLTLAEAITWSLKFGAIYAACGYVAVAVTVAIKWVLVWRVKPSSHNLWTSFVWRNELVWNFVEAVAIPWVGAVTVDTPIQAAIFRAYGAKIGKNTSIATWFLDDPDLIAIGDNCNIMKSADLQTHLFQDRVMQLDWVRLAEQVDVGSGTFILPGAIVNSGAEISSGSLVARNDQLLSNSRLHGNPVETI